MYVHIKYIIYTYTNTYIHTYKYTYTHTYIHKHTHIYTYIYIRARKPSWRQRDKGNKTVERDGPARVCIQRLECLVVFIKHLLGRRRVFQRKF